MSEKRMLTEKQLESFKVIANLGLDNASKAMATMTNLKVMSKNPTVDILPIGKLGSMVGGIEENAVGVYLQISGDISGHILFLWGYDSACRLVDILMEDPDGTAKTLDEIGQSAVKEVGNLVGSFFLNSVADFTGLRCNPSPPVIIIDMMGAIVNRLSSRIAMDSDYCLVVDTTFKEDTRTIIGNFMLIPSSASLGTLASRLGNEI